ncbi:MAG TPA: beta-phosphoglucomutase [Candidatus Ornithoclostridium faecavium]|nr:beta-phosphoglucomutase [Candidatus Ornithoclostridium faecavium]
MKYDGIIFDLDGVICSTDEYHYLAWKKLAEKLGIKDFTKKDNERQRGVSRMESLEVVLEKTDKKFTQEEKVALATEKNEYYKQMLAQMSKKDLADDVKDTLDAIKAKGIRIAIGSSSKNAKFILSRIGLLDYFDAISDGENITRTKPDPQVFTMAAEFLGLDPSRCLVVEDAEAGIMAGKTGGFDTAALGSATKCPYATYRLSTFSDLKAIVL